MLKTKIVAKDNYLGFTHNRVFPWAPSWLREEEFGIPVNTT